MVSLGKLTLFIVGMGILLALVVPTFVAIAETFSNSRKIIEVGLVIILIGWIGVLLVGTRRLLWTGKLI